MKKSKKLISMLLVVALCVTALPFTAFAGTSDTTKLFEIKGTLDEDTSLPDIFPSSKTKTFELTKKRAVTFKFCGITTDDAGNTVSCSEGWYKLLIYDSNGDLVTSSNGFVNWDFASHFDGAIAKDLYITKILPKGKYKMVLKCTSEPGYTAGLDYHLIATAKPVKDKLESVTIKKESTNKSVSSITLSKGYSTELKASKNPSYIKGDVKWTTSNKNVATVSSSGKVVAKNFGTATITAKCNGVKDTVKVKVTKAYKKYWVGKSASLVGYVDHLKGYKNAKWKSSDKSIVKVTSKGKITTKKHGTATISCTIKGTTYKFVVRSYSKTKLKNKVVNTVEDYLGVDVKVVSVKYPKVGYIELRYEPTSGELKGCTCLEEARYSAGKFQLEGSDY